MRITLNLATRPFADLAPALKRLRLGMGVLAVLCLALGLGLHALNRKAEQARATEHSLDGQFARVTGERQGYLSLMREPPNARLLTQTEALNQIFDEKAFSWTLAMENLETVLPGGVQVTTLEPVRDKDGQITLHLQVVGPRDLGVDLVRNLEHSKRFLQPRIVGENAASEGNGANQKLEPVSDTNRFEFDLLAEYNPPTPEESGAAKKEKQETAPAEETGGAERTAAGHGSEPRASVRRLARRGRNEVRAPYTGETHARPAEHKPNPAVAQPPASGGPR